MREFAESSYGRKVPEVSGLLVEIIILYKQAQEIPWIPDNLRRMQAWWGEASRKRKWLSEIMDEAQAPTPIASSPMVLAAEVLEEPELFPIPEMSVQPPPSPPGKRGGYLRWPSPAAIDSGEKTSSVFDTGDGRGAAARSVDEDARDGRATATCSFNGASARRSRSRWSCSTTEFSSDSGRIATLLYLDQRESLK